MSQRPSASRPASRSPTDGQRITLPPVRIRDDSTGERPIERQDAEQSEARTYPPIQPSPHYGRLPVVGTPGEESRPAPSRSLGLDAMLNPSDADGFSVSSRRSGGTDSPLSTVGRQSYFPPNAFPASSYTIPGQQTAPRISPTQEVPRASFSRGRGTSPRRILTPTSRNPQTRNTSLGRLGGPTLIDAQQSPFLQTRGRQYQTGPGQAGMDIPPIPSSQGQQHYGFNSAAAPSGSDPPTTMSSMQAPSRESHSQSTSPSMSSASAHPSSSQASPASFLYKGGPPPTSGSYFPGQSFASASMQAGSSGGLQYQASSASGTEGSYSFPPSAPLNASASTSDGKERQKSDPVQVLTITTSQGIYNVPVDVHQASRLADEKRARNAGASARFRQRRKEKEKEASTTIEKMQQTTRDLERRLRDAEQERDYYRVERDKYRDVIYQTPNLRHLAVGGPASPQSMRSGPGSFPGLTDQPQQGRQPLPGGMGFHPHEIAPERATRRRRTDTSGDFTSVGFSLPPASSLAPVQNSGYSLQSPTSLPALQLRPESSTASQGLYPSQALYSSQAPHPQATQPPQPVQPAQPTQQAQPSTAPDTTSTNATPSSAYPRETHDRRWSGENGRR